MPEDGCELCGSFTGASVERSIARTTAANLRKEPGLSQTGFFF
jgi:hypothetical protein